MPKQLNTQSQNRFNESVGKLFAHSSQKKCLFIKSSSDEGVIRNGGRNGARFAPQSFLATFRKWSQDENVRNYQFIERETASSSEEKLDFHQAQKAQSVRIKSLIQDQSFERIIHLGGGHDHIYPLVTALAPTTGNIVIINVDAHADTRTDEDFHSGTPFRQIAQEYPGRLHLFQIGLHSYANSFSTLSPLPEAEQKVLYRNEIDPASLEKIFLEIRTKISPDSLVVFSLDADAMEASQVPGVSAVNPDGLTMKELREVWRQYRALPFQHGPILGIYELNPVYDSTASLSMRTMAGFVFETFQS